MNAHRWENCKMCGLMVVCGKCGNNCCNGGYGTIDGKECDACPSAYEMQDKDYAAQSKINDSNVDQPRVQTSEYLAEKSK